MKTLLMIGLTLLAVQANAEAFRCHAGEGQESTVFLGKSEDCPSKWILRNVEATCVDQSSPVLNAGSATPLQWESHYAICVEPVDAGGTYFAKIYKLQILD